MLLTSKQMRVSRCLTIEPVAQKGYGQLNSPRGEAEWAIDPWPLRAKGL